MDSLDYLYDDEKPLFQALERVEEIILKEKRRLRRRAAQRKAREKS
jgi:hypothetical protein